MTLQRLLELWSERTPRERVLLAGGATGLAIVALYLFLWQPGLAASRRLEATLPKLRAQVELMRAQQSEIAALRKTARNVTQAELRTLLQASLTSAPFQKSVQGPDMMSTDRARVQVTSARFDEWLRWTADLQRHSGVRLERCTVTALAEPGAVRIEATFAGAAATAAR